MPSCRSIPMLRPNRYDHCIYDHRQWLGSSPEVSRGTALRYYIEKLLPHDGASWPWATFLINLSGAFVLGCLLEGLSRLGEDSGWRLRARLCAGTGFCGAFTTYSTFALEIVLLGRHGYLGTAVSYGLLSVVGGVITAWLGMAAMASVHRRRTRA